MRNGTKITASWVSFVRTVTLRQIRQEHNSFGGRTPISTRCRRSASEITDTWLPANENWLLGSIGGMIGIAALYFLLLGAIMISQTMQTDSETQEIGKWRRKKQEIGFITQGGTSTEVWVGVLSRAQIGRPITQEKLESQKSKHHSGITSKMLRSHQMHEQSVQQHIIREPRLHSQGEIITNLRPTHHESTSSPLDHYITLHY
jgi:hypothetical protein